MQHYGMAETMHPPRSAAHPGEAVALRPPRYRVERRAIYLWTLNAVIGAVVVIGLLVAAYFIFESARPWLGPIIAIVSVIYFVNITIMPTVRYLVHRWETTDQAVYSLKGWLELEWRITPVSRIQSIDTIRSPLQQLFKLATLRVTTAARQGGIVIDGLDAEVAAETARRLTEITQLTPGDAT
jgi:membrane protein YdbS with pleckstrin-like domain